MIERIAGKFNRTLINLIFKLNLEKYILSTKRGAIMLCYHGVDEISNKSLNYRFYSKIRLEKQFIIFKKYFNVISIDDYFDEKFDKTKLNIALSFDDGYLNNFKYLLPLVEKYKMPVSVYFTAINKTHYNFLWADFIDIIAKYSSVDNFRLEDHYFERKNGKYIDKNSNTIHRFIKNKGIWSTKETLFNIFDTDFKKITSQLDLDDYWKLMSDEEIRKFNESAYTTIGSHGFFHNNLGNISITEAICEMKNSKQYLENIIQEEINEIAYPDGSYTREVLNEAEKIGYTRQLAVNYLFKEDKTDKRVIDRTGVYPVYSVYNEIVNF